MSVVGYSPTPISLFEEYTLTGLWNGTGSSVILQYTRINNLCTLIISGGMSATSNNYYTPSQDPPVRFRPTRTVCFPIMVEANNQMRFCYAFINTNGTIYAPIASGTLGNTLALTGPPAGAGTFWTIDFPSVSYYVN